MSEPAPTVTVVVPLYNTERYIAQTLASILAQTYRDFEVVVIDDASSDHGPRIVRDIMRTDARIRMLRQENRGLAGARNSGIRAARGRYIALLDADDLWHPEKLQRHVAHLDANPAAGVSYAPSLFIDDNGKSLGLKQTPRLKQVTAAHIFCRNPVGNGSAAVLRRRALDDVCFEVCAPEGVRACWFDESFRQSEDIELWSRMAATTSWTFEGIAEPLTYYRVSAGGLSANVEKQFETWCRMRDKIARIAPDLVVAHGQRSEAYQRRYLARRLAAASDGKRALSYAMHAISIYPKIIIEEPARTLTTLAAAAVMATLPNKLCSSAVKRLGARRPQLGSIAAGSIVAATPATAG